MQVLECELPPAVKAPSNPALGSRLSERIARDFKPRWDQQWGGKFMLHGRTPDSNAIRLDGNDYLSVTGHPQIVHAQVEALRKEQEFVVQSGVFHLNQHPTHTLEMALAGWVGKDDGFICQSGYAANVGLLQVIADAQTPVYLDSLAHMSLWEGAHAARAPAYAFRHNDPAHLARMIASATARASWSSTRSTAPPAPLPAGGDRGRGRSTTGCMILVDESHSLGTHGPKGAGLCAELNLTDRVHFITASLAKAFAGRAGFFTAPANMRLHLMFTASPTSSAPACCRTRSPAWRPRWR
jgi:CAI-1 autoinducer synthase